MRFKGIICDYPQKKKKKSWSLWHQWHSSFNRWSNIWVSSNVCRLFNKPNPDGPPASSSVCFRSISWLLGRLSAITNHPVGWILMLSLCPSSLHRPLCRAWHEADCGCGCHQVCREEVCLWRKGHQVCTEGWQEEVNFPAGHKVQSAVLATAAAAAHLIAAPLLLSRAAFSQAQPCHQGLA